MRNRISVVLVLTLALTVPTASPVHAFGGSLLAKQTDEVIEFFVRKFAGELGEAGGKKAVREAVEAAVKRHGDEALRMFRRLGPHAARATARHGDEAFLVLRRYGDEGLALLRHSGDEVIPLVRRHGNEAAELCIRCPGAGQTVLRELGEDGLLIAEKLPKEDVTRLAHMIPGLRKKGALDGFVALLKKEGDSAFRWMRRNPKTVRRLGLAGAAVYLLHNPELARKAAESAGKGAGSVMRALLAGVNEGLGGGVWGTLAATLVLAILLLIMLALLDKFLPIRRIAGAVTRGIAWLVRRLAGLLRLRRDSGGCPLGDRTAAEQNGEAETDRVTP